MVAFNYGRVMAVSLKMIGRFGQSISITRFVEGDYNPSTSTAPVTETTQTGLRGLFDNYKTKDIDGTLVQRGDVKMLVAALGVSEPKKNDFVTDKNGTVWTIEFVDTINPNGNPILYTFQLRR